MNLLQKLTSVFSSPNLANVYQFDVQCHRCGEVLHGRANLNSEMSIEYDDQGNTSGYRVRKVLVGKDRCFQQIDVTLTFDAKRKLVNKDVFGGKWVEPT